MDSVSKGRQNEDRAVKYLQEKGYKIIARNYTKQFGEIDIIVEKGKFLCFIEVKSVYTDRFGSALEKVTPIKAKRIVKTARQYLFENKISNKLVRFDIIAIQKGKITHIENAFTATSDGGAPF